MVTVIPVTAPPLTVAVAIAPAPGPSTVVVTVSKSTINSNRCSVNPFVWYVFFSTLFTVAPRVFKIVTDPVVS